MLDPQYIRDNLDAVTANHKKATSVPLSGSMRAWRAGQEGACHQALAHYNRNGW